MKNTTGKTIARIVITLVLFINACLTMKGINPIPLDENAVTEVITGIVSAAMIIWSWWKNAPLTKAGKKGQAVTEEEKTKVS